MARYARLTTVSWGPKAEDGDPIENNVRQACEQVDTAAQEGSDLVCLAELFAHRNMDRPEAIDRAEPLPNAITEQMGKAAARNDTYVIAGLLEREGDDVYNSAVLIDREGEIVGQYRKNFPTPEEIESGTTPGTEAPVYETDFGRVGMAICWDLHFPELAVRMAEKDVQLICWPSMYQGGLQLRLWAYLADAYVMSAWPGHICEIIDMNGYRLAGTNYGYSIASADVNFDRDVFLRCTARQGTWHKIREKYGDRLTMELMHAQGTFSLASESDEISVEEIAEEFDLDRRVPYYQHCRDVREKKLRASGK